MILLIVSSFSFYYFPKNQKAGVISSVKQTAETTSSLLRYAFAIALNEEDYEALPVDYNNVKDFKDLADIIIYTEKMK